MNRAIRRVGIAVTVLILILVGQLTYFQVVDAKRLADDPRNVRKVFAEYNRPRGQILTADGEIVARSVPTTGDSDFKYQREYPLGGLFAQISGYQSFLQGNSGAEESYDRVLTGREKQVSLGNLGDIVQGKQDTQNVVLSLRRTLQQAAADQLEGRNGSVVLLDVKTGAVLAMYSNPTYDPNPLAGHDTAAVNGAFFVYNTDPAKPLLPRSYAELFPPGSTFKTVTSIAALDAGKVTLTDPVFPSQDHIDLPQSSQPLFNFGNQSCGGTLFVAFTNSCNWVFAQLGLDLGNDFVPRMANCGVAAGDPPPLDLGLPGAVASKGPPAGSFDNDKPSFARAGIGQDPVAVTPLEMAMVAAGIANGGVMMAPHVGQQITNSDGAVLEDIAPEIWKTCTSPQTAAEVTSMMVNVVEQGTGVAARLTGVAVAGKSGTAQTGVEGVVHAWFVAFAPAEAPRYAVSVIVEGTTATSEQTGGAVAAPLAGAMLEAALGTG